MHVENGYRPRQSRTAGIGGALLINGAVLAGLIYSAPNILPKTPPTILEGINIPLPPEPVPPPPNPEPRPDPKPTAQQPLPNAPDPIIKTDATSTINTTTTIYPPTPPLDPPAPVGPPVAFDPPLPPAPFVGASADPRFARDFQPIYPPREISAQRDGIAVVRVLIGVDGRVKAVEQVNATSDAFFDATKRQALAKWRFRPATRGGVPEESWKTLTVRFELQNR